MVGFLIGACPVADNMRTVTGGVVTPARCSTRGDLNPS
jgi:hypothetical protein